MPSRVVGRNGLRIITRPKRSEGRSDSTASSGLAFMWHSSPIILNAGDPSKISLEQPIDIALTLSMAELKARFIDRESGAVHYRAIRVSEEFERYKELTKGLRSFDLRDLKAREQRLAFWINIYNTAVIHGVIEQIGRASCR